MVSVQEEMSALPSFYEQEMLEYEPFEGEDFDDNDALYEETLMAAFTTTTKESNAVSLSELRPLTNQVCQQESTMSTNNNGQTLVVKPLPAFSKERSPSITTF